MDEEEMTYVEGGSLNTLKNNLYGLYGIVRNYMAKWMSSATIGRALQRAGMSWKQIGAIAGCYWSVAGKVSAMITSVTRWMGAHAVAIGLAVGAIGTFALWNVRMFY